MCCGSKKERQKSNQAVQKMPDEPPKKVLPCQKKEEPPPLPQVDPILEVDRAVTAVGGTGLTMTLRTSLDFDGTGVLTVVSGVDKVKFSHRGQPVQVEGNRAELTEGLFAGIPVVVEAVDASTFEGVELKWELKDGAAPKGAAVTKKLTAIKANIEVHKKAGGALTKEEKAGDGRVIHLQSDPARFTRAKVTITCAPAQYVGTIVLTAIKDNVDVFAAADGGAAMVLPHEIAVGPDAVALDLFIQGKTVSDAKVDTGLKLAIRDLADTADTAKMTVMKTKLEIFDYAGTVIADDKKDANAGAVLLKQNTSFTQPRAKFRIAKEPKDAPCKLVLKSTNTKVSLFPEANEKHVDAEVAETLPKDILATTITDQVKGLVFWAEGTTTTSLKETVLQLDAEGVDDACDKVGATVVFLCHDDGTHPPPKLLPIKNGITTTPAERHKIKVKLDHALGAGTYAWTSTSTKFDLSDQTTQVVTLTAKGDVSASLDAEELKVVFTPNTKPAFEAITHKLTVFKVKFTECSTQKYGFDDMDDADNANDKPHHLSVKKSDTTNVTVTITGGATSTHLELKSADTSIADITQPAKDLATFDLVVNGKAKDNDEVGIEVKAKEHEAALANELKVNVYKEIVANVTVYQMHDSTVPATALSVGYDATATETAIDSWYKKAVAKFVITDGGLIDAHYDLNGNGKLELDPGATSAESQVASAAAGAAGQKVVIVHELSWQYRLDADAPIGTTTVTMIASCVPSLKFFVVGTTYVFGAGASAENVTIASKAANTLTFTTATTKAHVAGDAIYWPLSGLSGNPVWVQELGKTSVMLQRTIGHEIGHSILRYLDVDASTSLMHFSAGRTDTRLRFMEQPKKYDGGNENQWTKPPR